MKHLRFNYYIAVVDYNERRHACDVIKELGIIYQYSTPQSLGDQFWFWNCENIPKYLPRFINELKIKDPMEYVGFGLNKEWAEKIKNYKT